MTANRRPTASDSKPVPPGTPPPSPPPGGPRHPEPTAPPPRDIAALVANLENQLSAPLHDLVTGVIDLDGIDTVQRAHLDEAAHLVSAALRVLARIDLPARSMPTAAPSGGLGSNPPAGSEGGRAGEQAVLAQSPGAVRDSRLVSDGPSAPGTAAHGGPATPPPGADFSLPRPPRFSMREGERRLYGGVEPGEGPLYDSLPGQQVGVAEYRGAP